MSDDEFGGFGDFGDVEAEAEQRSGNDDANGHEAAANASGGGGGLASEAMVDTDVQELGEDEFDATADGFGFGFDESDAPPPTATQLAEQMSSASLSETAASTAAAEPPADAAAAADGAATADGNAATNDGLSKAIPTLPEGMKASSVAASLNKHCLAISQPFVAGADLISQKKWTCLAGLSLQTMVFNVAMTAPGSFCLCIGSEPNGKGELLAKERGIAAPLTFTQTRITFGNPPSLEAGKEYYFLLRLERGAFKFQATPHTSVALRASAYAPTTKDWIPSELSFVFRSTYAKALPKRGDICGMLTVRIAPRRSSRRLSLKTNSAKKRFVVLEESSVRAYKGIDAGLIFNLPCKVMEYIEAEEGFDCTMFSIVTEDKMYQMICSSRVLPFSNQDVECKRWITKLRQALKDREQYVAFDFS